LLNCGMCWRSCDLFLFSSGTILPHISFYPKIHSWIFVANHIRSLSF
jgi:hypothetical protein